HRHSRWRSGKFVAINCAAIPESLIESELFGYQPGAFTGASKNGYIGKIREADGGVLFLDEIGDMPLALQTRLLRVLQEK
ncbi:sigma-54 factor interaction domain-containing protein, partial [Mycobacterium tuberculosis]|nr:sigma-54 factor interaction domain-containing protein [Mycobacterium tuberculosis]